MSKNSLEKFSKSIDNIGFSDSEYVEKFNFTKEAFRFKPEEHEISPLLAHITKVYFIFIMELIYTGLLIGFLVKNPTITSLIFSKIESITPYYVIVIIGILIVLLLIINNAETLTFMLPSLLIFISIIAFISSPLVSIYQNFVLEAFVVTCTIFFSSALFGLITKNDLSGWSMPLFGGLCSMIMLGVLQQYFHNDLFEILILLANILIFTIYTVYDNQLIKIRFLDKLRDDIPDTYFSWWHLAIESSIEVYMDFVYLFLDILSILGSDDDDD